MPAADLNTKLALALGWRQIETEGPLKDCWVDPADPEEDSGIRDVAGLRGRTPGKAIVRGLVTELQPSLGPEEIRGDVIEIAGG